MRVLKALIISLLVYALFIWLYLTQFSKIEILPSKLNHHVIKIDIRDIPVPVKAAPPVIKAKPKNEAVPIKQVETKPIVKKKLAIKKKPKEKIVKKKPVKKKVVKKEVVKKEIKKKKTKELEAFESEMVYIPEPMIQPKKSQPQTHTQPSDLGSFLAKPSRSSSSSAYPNKKIQKLYGSAFHDFTPTQKKFIENNLNTIQEITQRTLTRRGYPEGAGRTGQEGTNVVSFNLHPNGNISNLRLKTRIGYRALDDNTLSLIRVAYMDYPYPSTTTKIVFYVTYSIYGY
ncbi:MAG: Ferric siderophore transport system, periplasmic binding protein TonB [uncultured Sulfurovum sp.]|uniref:Ferric siderophore transport system, periplasmic binding protein TonB n=1 Tax=uncultured Sulfurovum sp. TaxID=269237 RepID=A0A6S6SKD7_9BACT|nr:MAG: Ferric siderophore transport system, periplasmic binding protein TonB [uncultured Sulfurovum sp.]